MFLKDRLERFMTRVSGYDSWGGGGYSDSDSGSVSGNYGSPGTGTGGDYGNSQFSEGDIATMGDAIISGALKLGLGFAASILSGAGVLAGGKAAFDVAGLNSKVQKQLVSTGKMTDAQAKAVSDEVTRRAVTALQSGAFDKMAGDGNPSSSDIESVLESPSIASVDSGTAVKSNMMSPQEAQVSGLYKSLFNRDNPDAEGVKYWTDKLNSGIDINELKSQMEAGGKDWSKAEDGSWVNNTTGNKVSDSTPTDYKYNENSPQVWEDYVNTFYDKAYPAFLEQSKQYKDITDSTTAKNDSLLTGQKDAYDQLEKTYDDNKITLSFAGQPFTFTPRVTRQTGDSLYNSMLNYSNLGKDINKDNYANNMALASGGNATLNYLKNLLGVAQEENSKSASDRGLTLNRDKLNAQVDASEPGIIDYIKGISTAGSGIKDLLGLFK